MSRQLVSRSPDLKRLADEGYEVDIVADQLLIRHVPYATAAKAVAYGTLVSELTTQGDVTAPPSTHVASWVGEIPCDNNGNELAKLVNERGVIGLGGGLTASCTFSSKPPEGYPNYYEKMVSYIGILGGFAGAIDPTATAQTYQPAATAEEESVFRYLDSSTSRMQIGATAERLALAKVVIIGLGGTGSYILDLVAKTRAVEIHLYDGDTFKTHNAFRAPGAAALEDLRASKTKVAYLAERYDQMRRFIVPHEADVDESNIEEIRDADFVFVAIDSGPSRKLILEKLAEFGLPFIDVGMGLYKTSQDSLGGLVRTTTSTPTMREHVWSGNVPFHDEEDDEYGNNIQTADLNMLNAALAVIRWKKLFGFYLDLEYEHSSVYTVDGNDLLNDDQHR